MISSRPARLRAGALAAAVALSGLGLATSAAGAAEPGDTPTIPAPGNPCPAAYTGTLTAGQKVTGLTTTRGTTPDSFTGTYVDSITNGLDSGVDLLLFQVEGSRFTKTDGSKDRGGWDGMSGSPVYAEDGSLVGAIGYHIDDSGPVIVGVTPAAALYAAKPQAASTPARVSVRSARAALARAGADGATTAQRIVQTPRISGFPASQLGLAKANAARTRGSSGALALGSAAGSSSFTGSSADITPGSPIAESYATGDIGYGFAGTTTARCGDDVYAFGHSSDDWLGETLNATLHPFNVSTIIGDDGYSASMIGNAGAAIGRFSNDTLFGAFGTIGALPTSTKIVSTSTFGSKVRGGASQVSQPELLPEIVADQVVSDYLSSRGGALGGTASVAWTIDYVRAGKTESFTRSNIYAARSIDELADEMVTDVAGDVYQLQENDYEPISITTVKVSDVVEKDLRATKIAAVQVLNRNGWQTISSRKALQVSRRNTLRVRVKLVPASRFSISSARTVNLPYIQPTRSTQSEGVLDVSGLTDDDYYLDDDFFGEFEDDSEFGEDLADASSFKDLLAVLKSQSSNDSVTATLFYATPRGSEREATTTRKTGAVVTGGITVPVRFSG